MMRGNKLKENRDFQQLKDFYEGHQLKGEVLNVK